MEHEVKMEHGFTRIRHGLHGTSTEPQNRRFEGEGSPLDWIGEGLYI